MQTNRESARRLSMRKQKHLDDLMAEIENLSKQLKDTFNSSVLHETIMQILETFMSTGKPHPWVDYLMPEDGESYDMNEFMLFYWPLTSPLAVYPSILSTSCYCNVDDRERKGSLTFLMQVEAMK